MTVLDGDTVSDSSCNWQAYRPSDVDELKSVVIVERVNFFWDLDWRAVPDNLFGPEQIEGIDIVIGCASTAAAREAIATHTAGPSTVDYWLDLASSISGNLFVLGEPLNQRNRRSKMRLRVVSELFPEIVDGALVEAEGLPGPDPASFLDGQDAFVSHILANHALMLLARLFRYGYVSYHGGFVNWRGGLRPLRIVPRRAQTAHERDRTVDHD